MTTPEDVTGQLASGGSFRATRYSLEFFDPEGSSLSTFDTNTFSGVNREGSTVVISRRGDSEFTAEAATLDDAGNLEAFLLNLPALQPASVPPQEEQKKGGGLRRLGCIGGIVGLVLLIGCVAILVVVSSGGDDDDDDSAAEPTATLAEATSDDSAADQDEESDDAGEPTDEEADDEPEESSDSDSEVTAPEPVSFDGSGDSLTDPIDLQAGILILEASHSGGGNFIVEIVSTETADSSLSINEIGTYEGTRGHPVQSDPIIGVGTGEHRFQVQADGNWSIEVRQPVWDSGDSIPVEYSGSGDGVVGPVDLTTGTIPLSLSHDGESNFIVQVVSVDGRNSDLTVNEIGPYQGEPGLAVRESAPLGLGLEAGLHVIIVEADGAWSMEWSE